MSRLLFTVFLLGICIYLGESQKNAPPGTVIAVSMRHSSKLAFTDTQATTEQSTNIAWSNTSTDMITPKNGREQCLSIENDDLSGTPAIVLRSCRNRPDQQWIYHTEPSHWQLVLDPAYCLATVNHHPNAGERLTVRLCTDSRTLVLLSSPSLTDSYQVSGTDYVLDSNVYGYVGLARQHGGRSQYWRWLQDALRVVTVQDCSTTYPVSETKTMIYDRDLACNRVAKMQSSYTIPYPEMDSRHAISE